MKKIRIRYNQKTCIGCGACQVSCKERNGLMEGEFIRRVTFCSGTTQSGRIQFPYSFSCNHCNNPKCTSVCPTGSLHKSSDGTVLHDDNLCIACGRCFWACPFGEISYNRTTGMTQKCDNCISLVKAGKQPKCVSFCPTGSLSLFEEVCEDVPCDENHTAFGKEKNGNTFLILGGGAASVYAAKAIREEDSSGKIIIISDDLHRPYRRPLLSKTPFKTFRGERLTLFDDNWFERYDVELHLREKVISLDAANKRVVTDKSTYSYDKCIYALGAIPFLPPFIGKDKKGVFTVRTIEDFERIKHACLYGNQAVIIGGGVIGIEFAQELKRYGMSVTILEGMPRLMARQLDEEMSTMLFNRLKSTGFQVETGIKIEEIEGDDNVTGVRLSDGRSYPANVVIVSCGIRANTGIAIEAGIKCSRAVVVNKYMETNMKDVWACGDAAELDNVNYSLWSQAMAEGSIAGKNAAGCHVEIPEFDTSLVLNSNDVNLFSLGDMGLKGKPYVKISSETTEKGFKINDRVMNATSEKVYCDGRLVGCALFGNLGEMENLRRSLEAEE